MSRVVARYRGEIYPDYEVTSDGKVFSRRRGKFLSPYKAGRYLQVTLPGKQPMLHRLVVESFNPGFAGKIIFKDGNPLNCSLSNLQTY